MADINDADLKELEFMADDLEREAAKPNEAEAEAQQAEAMSDEIQAYGMARAICELAARGAVLRWDCLSFSDQVKEQAAQVLVPVMLKYDLQSEFMARWKEELAAGAFFASLIFTSYKKIKQHEAELEAEAEAENLAQNA